MPMSPMRADLPAASPAAAARGAQPLPSPALGSAGMDGIVGNAGNADYRAQLFCGMP